MTIVNQEEIGKGEGRRAVYGAIAFFDLFDFPLTAYEIWEEIGGHTDFGELQDFLDIMSQEQVIGYENGLYFLPGRRELITTRAHRYNYAREKVKIARRFARLFSFLPFVKMVAAANIIGAHNLKASSDIDFFIITSPRRLWLTRLYCAGLASILGVRPTAADKRNKICLSFYVSSDRLDISDQRLENDCYFDHWRRSLVLLYNKENMFERFLAANGLGPEVAPAATATGSRFGDCLEKAAMDWQLKIMPPALKAALNNSDGVRADNSIIKLYLGDRRREYAEKYGNKISEIIKENA